MDRRTQADRTAETRGALIAAARRLFAEHGFAGVGTDAITSSANVSRGALYHHFADKTELFAAVLDAVEADVTERIATGATASGETSFAPLMMASINTWLDACDAPEIQRIVLTDGPSVLGWARWREIIQPYALSLVEGLVSAAIAEGSIAPMPSRALAHALIAVADEAAMYVNTASDKGEARSDMLAVLARVLESLTTPAH